MGLVILVSVVFFIVGIKSFYSRGADFIECLFIALMGILQGSLAGIFAGLLLWALPMETELIKTEYEVVNLQDGNSVNGSFFLGSGYINQSMKYTFYYKDNHGYHLKQIKASNAVINYSDTPKIVRYKETPTGDWFNLIAIDLEFKEIYKIYVPKGTIKTNYNLDAN